jgi:hypothetical protein
MTNHCGYQNINRMSDQIWESPRTAIGSKAAGLAGAAVLLQAMRNLDPRHDRLRCFAPVFDAVPQIRKNTNQMIPRIRTASPVEAASSAATEGPGSAWRASFAVSTIRPSRCVVAMRDLISVSTCNAG